VTPKQAKLTSFCTAKQPCSSARAAIITDLVTKMIVGNMFPISTADRKNFKNLLNYLEPSYILPSRPTFTRRIENLFQSVRENVKTELSAESFICLTVDIWTDASVDAYLGITAHYLKGLEMKSCALAVKLLEQRHTGTNIAQWIEDMWDDMGILLRQIVAMVHDNGENVVKCSNCK